MAFGVTTVVMEAKPALNSVEVLSILKPFGRTGFFADVFSQKWSVFLIVPVAAGIRVNVVRLEAMLVCGVLIGHGARRSPSVRADANTDPGAGSR